MLKKIVASLLIFSTMFAGTLSVQAATIGKEEAGSADYYAEVVYGKVFIDGENERVDKNEQLNTSIQNIELHNGTNKTTLEFDYNGKAISVNAYMLDSSINNTYNQHYVLSPINFSNSLFDVVVIKFTTNANEYDLMPVNFDLTGKSVISIIFEEKLTGDIHYWQGELQGFRNTANGIATLGDANELSSFSTAYQEEYDKIVKNANEEYYKRGVQSEFTLSMEEYEQQLALAITKDQLETENNNENANLMRSVRAEENNPFYDEGIPNSVFQTATDEWSQRVAWRDSNVNETTSLNYYTYSYENFGSDTVYTLTFLLHFRTTTVEGTTSGGAPRAQKHLKIMVEANETIVYYPNEGLYDYGLGLNDLVDFYPTIEMKKTGNDVGHIVVDRIFGGTGYNNRNRLSAVDKALNIVVGVIDGAFTHGAITMTYNILDVFVTSVVPESVSLGADLFEFGYTVDEQIDNCGKAIGSVKVEMDGYLRKPGHYFFLQSNFTANTLTTAKKTTWVMSYSID